MSTINNYPHWADTSQEKSQVALMQKSIPSGILGGYLELDFPFYFINDQMLRYLGYDNQDEFIQQIHGSLLNIVHPLDRSRVAEDVTQQHLSNHDEYSSTYRVLRKDGTHLWVKGSGKPFLTDRNRLALVFVCIDITEQKELENQLELYRKASQGGAFTLQVSSGYPLVYGNDIFYHIIDYTYESFEQEHDNLGDELLYPEDLPRIHEELNFAIANGLENIDLQMRIITGKGAIRWIQVRGTFELKHSNSYLNGFVVDVTSHYELTEKIQRSEERYRIALQEMPIDIYEYDFHNKTHICFHSSISPSLFLPYTENAPQSILESGLIHPASTFDYQNLFKQIEMRTSRAIADIQICIADCPDTLFWVRLTLSGIFDESGFPSRAIIVAEDISQQKQAELSYQHDLQLRETMTSGFIAGSRANLSKNQIEFAQSAFLATDTWVQMTYDELATLGAVHISNPDDKERYFATLSREALLESFSGGRTTVSFDYRRTNAKGHICWVRATSHLLRDVINKDIYSYSSIRDINEQKMIELALQHRAEHDDLTGAYNKNTALRMIENAIDSSKRRQIPYCLLLFQLDHFNYIIQKSGHKKSDDIICELNAILQSELPEPKIIGRLFGDEMIVLLGNDITETQITRDVEKIQHLIATSSLMSQMDLPTTLSISGVFCNTSSPPLEELLSQLHHSILECQQQGGNCHMLSKSNTAPTAYIAQKTAVSTEYDVSDFVMRCAFTLSSANNFTTAANVILRNLCHYYQANFGCILELSTTKDSIQEVHTWADKLLISTMDFGTATMLSSLQSLLKETAVLFVKQIHELSDVGLREVLIEKNIQNFCAIALDLNGIPMGFLIVTNIRNKSANMSLFDFLGRIIANDLDKRCLKQEKYYFQHYDSLTGLRNRKNYLCYVEEYLPDAAISLGIIVIDINGLKQINAQHGFSSGDSMVLFVAKKLQEVFLNAHIFRLSGDEFWIACENLTSDAFYQLISTFKTEVDDTHPGSLSIGYTWADADIDVDKLTTLAEEKLQIAKQNFYRKESGGQKNPFLYDTRKLVTEIEARQYEMYLQPKAFIATGKISGAEALVRYRDAQGAYIPPSRFVPQLEQNGNIHFIDLFIFEEVCRTLKEWQEKNYALMPISLNFSRTTLLTDHLISKMEEIYQRYQVPKEFIEIEVTESIGSVERQTLLDISDQIVDHNYRLSLDDFGAKYSNLSILSTMKLHVLKLDKSLVNDIFSNPNTRIVVRNFLLTCKELSISSVAEGVETKEQLDILRELECDYAQGYYFNKPIPLIDFERLYLHFS